MNHNLKTIMIIITFIISFLLDMVMIEIMFYILSFMETIFKVNHIALPLS